MKCLHCQKTLIGRSDKKYCDQYCKSGYQYIQSKKKEKNRFQEVQSILRKNRQVLKKYNKAGKSYVRTQTLLNEGFDPNYFTNYWKNKKGDIYLFCFEFGFLKTLEKGQEKFLLILWQDYME